MQRDSSRPVAIAWLVLQSWHSICLTPSPPSARTARSCFVHLIASLPTFPFSSQGPPDVITKALFASRDQKCSELRDLAHAQYMKTLKETRHGPDEMVSIVSRESMVS